MTHTMTGTVDPYTHAMSSPITLDADVTLTTFLTKIKGGFFFNSNFYRFQAITSISAGSTSFLLTINSNSSSMGNREMKMLFVIIKNTPNMTVHFGKMNLQEKTTTLVEVPNSYYFVGLTALSAQRSDFINVKLATDLKSIVTAFG